MAGSCIPSGEESRACSATVQQFTRGHSASTPSANAPARRRGSALRKRDPSRVISSSNIPSHRPGFTLGPAAARRSSRVVTNRDDQTVAAPSPAPTRRRSRAAAGIPGGHMRRGEVWWAEFDERRPVVLLSGEDPSGFRAMQVVAPADTDISGLGTEVAVGVQEGLPFDGVLRFAFPRPGFTPCTWLTTLSREDLIERAGAVSAAKLSKIDDALRASEQRAEWTPAAAARLSEIKDSLRRRTQADG